MWMLSCAFCVSRNLEANQFWQGNSYSLERDHAISPTTDRSVSERTATPTTRDRIFRRTSHQKPEAPPAVVVPEIHPFFVNRRGRPRETPPIMPWGTLDFASCGMRGLNEGFADLVRDRATVNGKKNSTWAESKN
jgi:hypothetical protein